MTKKSKKFLYLGLIFIVIWAINILIISPSFDALNNEVLANIIRTIIKLILWCGYGYIFIKKYNEDLYLKKESLFKIGNYRLLFKLLIMLALVAIVAMIKNHSGLNINTFTIDDFLNKFLLVGIEEELVFRGLILNGLMKKNSFFTSSLITSILFALIHVPLYIRSDLTILVIVINVVKIVCVSSVYNYIFKETKSLSTMVIIHSLWDLLFFMFVE